MSTSTSSFLPRKYSITLVALFSVWFMTTGSFWSICRARWCDLPSAAKLAEANVVDMKAAAVRRRKSRMKSSLWPNQGIAVFGQRQNLPAADLNRRRRRNDPRSLAGGAFDGVDGVEANVEAHALRDQALDQLAVVVFGAQQV